MRRWALAGLSILAGALLAVRLAMSAVGWWLDSSDAPSKSDLALILSGRYTASLYAADLFARGYAPRIWMSRPARAPGFFLARGLGIKVLSEDEINLQILLKKGVPRDRIRFIPGDMRSTADEAAALRRELGDAPARILVVTSRYHVRRARLIFRRALPRADVRVVATPYEQFDRKWWRRKGLAEQGLLELCKTVFYLAGGRFLSRPEAGRTADPGPGRW